MDRPLRENLALRTQEAWRPLPCTGLGVVRRFFDLQSGSIWRDLAVELATLEGTFVDAGCGAQPYRPLLPRSVRYVGIDWSGSEEHFGYRAPDTTYYQGDRWPLADGEADTVLASETLEHVPDPALFLREAHRTLKPGGRLILTVPFSARWHFVPHDYWRFTPSGLAKLFREAGFADVAVYGRGNALTVACYKVMLVCMGLLAPQQGAPLTKLFLRVAGLPFLPLFFFCAALANVSLFAAAGEDCLGYTATAVKPRT